MNGLCQFQIAAFSRDDLGPRFRFATSGEALAVSGRTFVRPGPPNAPNAATIDEETGVFTWDTSGAQVNPGGETFYSAALMIENQTTKAPLSFLIRLVDVSVTAPPFFVSPPSPDSGTVFAINEGSALEFPMRAASVEPLDLVNIEVTGLPSGATFEVPVFDNPVEGGFSWTPAPGQIGNYVMNFVAVGSTGLRSTPHAIAVEVFDDREAPTCEVSTGLAALTVRDVNSGLATIDIVQEENATVEVPSFSVGTTAAQVVQVTRLNPDEESRVELRVSDRVGNSTVCTLELAATATHTPTDTPTVTPTPTPTDTPTATPTGIPTNTPTATSTPTSLPTDTPTPTHSATSTPTHTPLPTETPTVTPTPTATASATSSRTDTPTSTPTSSPADTPTATHTATSTPTDTPTFTPTRAPVPPLVGVQLVSGSCAAIPANGPSGGPALDAGGSVVAFYSDASNLVPNDTNWVRDVFIVEVPSNAVERISIGDSDQQANGPSHAAGGAPDVSGDGRLVAFYSAATNLVPDDTNGVTDVFVRDRDARTTERLSLSSTGTQGNGASLFPSMSADGRFVAFQSLASNLVEGDTNGVADIFVRDPASNTTEIACGIVGNGFSAAPSISAGGTLVAFASAASNLVPGDTNGRIDIFVCDRSTGTIQRVSAASDGAQGNGDSILPAISCDGRIVAFKSLASNLVANDRNGVVDVFAHDRSTGMTERISVSRRGGNADDVSFPPGINDDGRFVVFGSLATNLVARDANGTSDIFVRDREAEFTTLVTEPGGQQANRGTVDAPPAVSCDGSRIAFVTAATNLGCSRVDFASIWVAANPLLTNPVPTATPTQTATPSQSPTATLMPTATASASPTATASATPSPTLTATGTATVAPTSTATPTATFSPTPTTPPTETETPEAPTQTFTATSTATATETPTETSTATATATLTATSTETATATPTDTPPMTATPTCAPTGTPYCSNECAPCPTIRAGCFASACGRCLENPQCAPEEACLPVNAGPPFGCCACATLTPTETATGTSTPTSTPTATSTPSPSTTPIPTEAASEATSTATPTNTAAPTTTRTPSETPSVTPTETPLPPSPTATETSPPPSPTPTDTPPPNGSFLAEEIAVGVTTISVDDIRPFPDRGVVRIGDELIRYNGKQPVGSGSAARAAGESGPGELLNVQRGVDGTAMATHPPGSLVVLMRDESCTGDCDGDGSVTIDKLVRGVNIALGGQPLESCAAFDGNGDGAVTIDELVRGVNHALGGCPE